MSILIFVRFCIFWSISFLNISYYFPHYIGIGIITMCKHMNVTNYPRSSTALCTQIYIFFHLNDPSNYIKCFLTCTIPSSPRQGLVPCLALASRFPPAGDDDDDRDHVDSGNGEDDYHDEILMLSRGVYILSNFMSSPHSDLGFCCWW